MTIFFKKLKDKKTILILCLIFLFLFLCFQSLFAKEKKEIEFIPQINIPGFEKGPIEEKTLAYYFRAFYKWSVTVIAILAVVIIMSSGLQWMLAAGNPSAIKQAQDQLFSALIGLVLILIAVPLLQLINPALVNLSSFEIPYIIPEKKASSEFFIIKTGDCDAFLRGISGKSIFESRLPPDYYSFLQGLDVKEINFKKESACIVAKVVYSLPKGVENFEPIPPEGYYIMYHYQDKKGKWHQKEGVLSLKGGDIGTNWAIYNYKRWEGIDSRYKYWVYLVSGKRQGNELISADVIDSGGQPIFFDKNGKLYSEQWCITSPYGTQKVIIIRSDGKEEEFKYKFIKSEKCFSVSVK